MGSSSKTSKKSAVIICGDYMEDYEVRVPYFLLQAFGVAVDCVSPGKKSGDKCFTAVHDYLGLELYTELQGHFFTLNADFDELIPDSYDALIIPGGRFVEHLSANATAVEIVKRFAQTGKPIATSCHSQIMLVAAGLLQGKNCTAFPSLRPVVELAGGVWCEQVGVNSALDVTECVKDGNIISSIGWPGHGEYMKVLVESMGAKVSCARGSSVLILCADYVEDYEINVPYRALQCMGCKVDVVSPSKKRGESCVTAIHDEEGAQTCSEKRGHNFVVTADWSNKDICVDKYECLIVPGGRCQELLVMEEKVLSLVKEFDAKEKVIAAIGHGTWLLAAANVLKGKKCGSSRGMKAIIKVGGGEVVEGEECVTHGNLVTATGWQALPSFITHLSNILALSLVF